MFPRDGLRALFAGGASALSLCACVTTTPTAATIEPGAPTQTPAAPPDERTAARRPGDDAATPNEAIEDPSQRAEATPAEPMLGGEPSGETVVEIPRAVEEPAGGSVSAAALAALEREQREARNAEIVINFYEMVFRDHLVAEAIALYGDDVYIQHTPGAPDGWDALEAYLVPYFRANPLARSEIQRVIAQDDLVVLHVLAKTDPVDRGRAVVDIFRVKDGKIVEHWDVVQPIPPASVNGNTMF